MHPLSGNLSVFTDAELAEKISQLYKMLNRYGPGATLYNQVLMLHYDYLEEQRKRFDQQLAALEKKTGKKLTGTIRNI